MVFPFIRAALRLPVIAAVVSCFAMAPATLGPGVVPQDAVRSFEAPVVGAVLEQPVAGGESHEWPFDLLAGEFLQVAVEPVAVDLGVTAIGPGGAVVSENAEPNIVLGIDVGARIVASLLSDRPGRYRLRVAARTAAGDTARSRYRLQVEARRRAVEGDGRRVVAHQRWSEGMRLFLQGSVEARRASVATFEEALRLLIQIGDSEGEALTLAMLASIQYALSDAKQGTAASARALEIWRKLGREREEGLALSDLGLLAYLAYDRASARGYYDRALAKHRAAGDQIGEATTLTRLGWIHYALGEPLKVIELNEQSLALRRGAGDPSGEVVVFNDLGRAYVDLGDASQALDAFQRALAQGSTDRNQGDAAYVLVRMGLLYLSIAEWQRALDALHQALAISRRAHDTRNEVVVLANLGSAHNRMGDTDEAVRYLESALPLARQIGFRNAEANVLYQLGVGTYLSGEPERSREYLQQALDIQSAVQDVRGQALTLRQLAAVQLALGLPREALPSITDAMKKSPAGDAVAYSGALTLANVHAALGDAPTAGATYQQALDRFRKIRARDRESAALVMFGDFQARQGRYAEARALLQQGLAVYESLRSRIVDPDLRMSYTARSLPFYQRYIDVLMSLERDSPGAGFAEEAFSTSERARARGLLEMLATSGVDIRRGVDPALVEKERTLRWDLNAKAAVQTSLLSGKRDDARLQLLEKQMTELSAALRETTTRIRQESPTYAELVEPQPLTPAEVGRLLDDDTVLLEYALGETRSWLYAVTPTSFDSFPLPSRRAIDDAARDVYRLLTSRQPVSGESAAQRQARVRRSDAELKDRRRALANLVLGPVGARLAGQWRGRRLAIVPAGALEYVPFGALPLPGAPGNAVGDTPLVRAHELVTLPSASVLALLRQPRGRRAAMSGVVAVVADPVFSADDPRVGKRATPVKRPATVPAPAPETPVEGQPGRSVTTRALEPFAGAGVRAALARLPFTRTEARAVVSLAPPASVLHATDFDASLSLITSGRLEGYRMVHFATHGLINSTRPELSGLALSLVDNRGRPQDGFLRLNTIYNLWLPADLVVLSACQSALGKEIAGEGLVGLTRGFMYAGAPRVVASLWQVSDLATAELMKRFYAGMLQRRLPASAALRAAQLEMARDPRWAPPYFWAGFVLQGDWR